MWPWIPDNEKQYTCSTFIAQWETQSPQVTWINFSWSNKSLFLYARLQTGRIMVWWCLSVRPSGSPSVSHSFPHFSPTCFDVLSWNFVCHFLLRNVWSSSSVVNMPLLELRILEIHSCPHFSVTCFDILSWNFAYDFVLLYYRSKLHFFNFRLFLLELCPFWNLEYWKYAVFRTFLLHVLTYWAEILHITLFYCTTDQARVSSICVNFCGSYAPFGT